MLEIVERRQHSGNRKLHPASSSSLNNSDRTFHEELEKCTGMHIASGIKSISCALEMAVPQQSKSDSKFRSAREGSLT